MIGCVFPAPHRDVKPGLAFSRDRVVAQAHQAACVALMNRRMRDWEISDDHFHIHRRWIGVQNFHLQQ
jgi:hypothetical protein